MKTFACVTTFNESYYNDIAYAMIKTYKKFWPKNINLYAYIENFSLPVNALASNVKQYDIHEKCDPNLQNILDWRGNHFTRGFLYKTYSIIHAAKNIKEDVLIYLDADSITYNHITETFLESLLPSNALASYMGVTMHKGNKEENAETCIFLLDKTHAGFQNFINHYEDIYESRDIGDKNRFSKPHDTWAFTECVQRAKTQGHYVHDLNPARKSQSPLKKTVLGEYFRHFKAKRKNDPEINEYVEMILNEHDIKTIDKLINENKHKGGD